ncbi:MAG: GNAT family N-acetyltransferase [bacterium]
MDINIREAKMQDYETLCSIFEEGDEYHRQALPHIFKKPDGSVRTKDFISSIISSKDEILFVAELNDTIIGVVLIGIRTAPYIDIMVPRRYAVIDNIVVLKVHRGKGVGKMLMKKAHEWISSKDIKHIELHVWEFNQSAIKFYEKLGYTTACHKMWKMP